MQMITGFDTYSETKIYMPCPHCEHQIETNLPQFILAMNGRKKIICAACTREYELKVDLLDTERGLTTDAPEMTVGDSDSVSQHLRNENGDILCPTCEYPVIRGFCVHQDCPDFGCRVTSTTKPDDLTPSPTPSFR